MISKKKVALGVFSVLVLGAVIARSYYARARAPRVIEDVLPVFSELPAGPRAPKSELLGARVGFTTFAEIETFGKTHDMLCKDTSARALMRAAREKKKAETEKKKAEGVDVTSSASSKKVSPMEQNPQVRWSCEGTVSSAIGDRTRVPATGRVLYIFDSAKHPLRHVSYRRVHRDHAQARADLLDSIAAVKALYGEPQQTSGTLPEEGAEFQKYEPYKLEWKFTDVALTVSGLSFGERGVDIYEAIEVPLPVRSDAPALASLQDPPSDRSAGGEDRGSGEHVRR